MKRLVFVTIVLLCAQSVSALVIDKDTTWQGDLHFRENIQILPDVTLRIEAGSRINFHGNQLKVSGVLVASDVEFTGEDWVGLLLKGSDSRTLLNNSVIRGAETGILVKGGAPVMNGLTLHGNKVGIELRGKAGGKIVDSTFSGNEKVGLFVKDYSTTAVQDCTFSKNGRYGAYLYHATPELFTGNKFFENDVGLMVAYHGTDPVVENNRFEKNNTAVQVDRAARPTIRGNQFLVNRVGLYTYRRSDPLVSMNRIEGNETGILVAYSSYPRITENDFLNNGLAIKLEFQSSTWEVQRGAEMRKDESAARSAFGGQGMPAVTEEDRSAENLDGIVKATGNWWGMRGFDELEEIGEEGNPSFIHDGLDQATFVDRDQEYPLDKVDFSGWSRKALTKGSQ